MLPAHKAVSPKKTSPRFRAWLRDPRTSVVFGHSQLGSVTIVGTIELTDDPALRTRFLETLADRNGMTGEIRVDWLRHMDTDGRKVGPVKVKKYITFDPSKLVY